MSDSQLHSNRFEEVTNPANRSVSVYKTTEANGTTICWQAFPMGGSITRTKITEEQYEQASRVFSSTTVRYVPFGST